MSPSSRLLNITVPWPKVFAAIPAVVLLAGGIAVSGPAALAGSIAGPAVASDVPAVVVPDVAITLPAPTGGTMGDLPAVAAQGPAPAGVVPVSSSRQTYDSSGIPVRALEGYRRAATLIGQADPGCHLDWELLAAIGRVESDHGRFGGNQLDAADVAQPGIIGIPLDGTNGTARITDSDGGALDRDSVYDRAVGPMQFIPSTWQAVGVDGDGDGVKNPQDMADAATATAVYLCSGPGDLRDPADLHAAIMRYNASEPYVLMVTALADTYRLGVSALPSTEPTLVATPSATVAGPPVLATTLGQKAAVIGAPMPPSTSTPAVTIPSAPVMLRPVMLDPTLVPDPIATLIPDPTPTATVPDPTPTVVPDPTPTATATPTPIPDPTPTATTTRTPIPDPTVVPDPTPTATVTAPDPTSTPTP